MIEALTDLGFSEKEANIYLLLTKEGALSAPKIAEHLHLDRRVVYDVLNDLQTKGQVTKKQVHGRYIYTNIDPKFILEDAYERYNNFKDILPQLKQKETTKPQINILKGKKAVQVIMTNVLQAKEEFLCMGRGGYLLEQLEGSKHQYVSKIKMLNWRMIQTEMWEKDADKRKFQPTELRYLPKGTELYTAFMTFSDKVYLASKQEEILVIEITDKLFAKTFKTYFELFWKIAKEKE